MTQFTIPDETHSAQGLAHSDLAEPKSRDFEALAQRDTGVVSGCLVTAQGTPDMTLAVASGVVRIAGVDHAVTSGNVTITANATAQPRYDDVVVNTSGVKSVIAGTPASEATLDDPAIDLTSFCWLAKVYVAAGATAIGATEFVSKAIPQNPNAFHDKLHAADHATGGPDAITPGAIGASTLALGSTPSTQAFGDAAAGGSASTASKNDHKHGMPSERAAASATPAAIGTAAAGSGTTDARSDHVHATGAGTPSTQALGDAAATGSGPAAAMTDHKHAMPALGTSAAAIGTSAGGSATTPSKSDHVHATGAGTPSTQAFGDAAATGSGPAAAMTDHKHAMPADPVTAHAAAGDPHTGYRLESADHSHASTGLQGGQIPVGSVTDAVSGKDGGLGSVNVVGNTGSTQTISLASGNYLVYTVNANCVFTMPSGLTSGKEISFTAELTDSGGPRTIAFTGVQFSGGAEPTVMSAAGAKDVYSFWTRDGGTTWMGAKIGTGFAT